MVAKLITASYLNRGRETKLCMQGRQQLGQGAEWRARRSEEVNEGEDRSALRIGTEELQFEDNPPPTPLFGGFGVKRRESGRMLPCQIWSMREAEG